MKPGGYFEIEASGQGFYQSPALALVTLPGSIKGVAPVFGGYYEVEKATGALAYFDYTTATTTPASNVVVDEISSGVGEFGSWQQLYVTERGSSISAR